jgi:hypothetical protein
MTFIAQTGFAVKEQQYKTTTGQDFTGTSEAVYTSIGNPMVFAKLKDSSTSKLLFISYGKMFDAAGNHLSISFKLRVGTNTSGTQIGSCDAYDLYHSTAPPWRTGRDLSMYMDEVTNLGAGNHNFVITGARNGYSDPQAISAWNLHIFEVLI